MSLRSGVRVILFLGPLFLGPPFLGPLLLPLFLDLGLLDIVVCSQLVHMAIWIGSILDAVPRRALVVRRVAATVAVFFRFLAIVMRIVKYSSETHTYSAGGSRVCFKNKSVGCWCTVPFDSMVRMDVAPAKPGLARTLGAQDQGNNSQIRLQPINTHLRRQQKGNTA